MSPFLQETISAKKKRTMSNAYSVPIVWEGYIAGKMLTTFYTLYLINTDNAIGNVKCTQCTGVTTQSTSASVAANSAAQHR